MTFDARSGLSIARQHHIMQGRPMNSGAVADLLTRHLSACFIHYS